MLMLLRFSAADAVFIARPSERPASADHHGNGFGRLCQVGLEDNLYYRKGGGDTRWWRGRFEPGGWEGTGHPVEAERSWGETSSRSEV
jgi:hypothetical protein